MVVSAVKALRSQTLFIDLPGNPLCVYVVNDGGEKGRLVRQSIDSNWRHHISLYISKGFEEHIYLLGCLKWMTSVKEAYCMST